MTLFGLPESDVAALVRAVADPAGDHDRDHLAERFARAAWSVLAEPGDGDAGTLLAALGAAPALDALLGGTDDVGAALGDRAADAVARWRPRLASDPVRRSLRQAARFGARLVVPGDAEWPGPLDDLGPHAPVALWVRGDPTRLSAAPALSLVGARAATGYGEHVTIELAAGLVDRGIAVVSGAAYGIDGAAHRAALASDGVTVAFLAGGVDRLYPAGHEALIGRIVDHGAVASEVPCGTAPTKWRFLQRNRLIAALGAATVVVEAGRRSGSLNTAGHAAALGRPLGAVPGPVTSSTSAGCHRLIREFGAVCVTDADEAAQLVGVDDPVTRAAPAASARRVRLLDALGRRSGLTIDALARASGLSRDEVAAELGALDLEGIATERADGWRRTG